MVVIEQYYNMVLWSCWTCCKWHNSHNKTKQEAFSMEQMNESNWLDWLDWNGLKWIETSSITGSAVARASNATRTRRETIARVPVKNLKKFKTFLIKIWSRNFLKHHDFFSNGHIYNWYLADSAHLTSPIKPLNKKLLSHHLMQSTEHYWCICQEHSSWKCVHW